MFSLLLLRITLLIIRVWLTNGAQNADCVFQTSNNSTYISLPKTSATRIIPVKLFYRVFLGRAEASRSHLSTAFMRSDFFNARVHARNVLARPYD